MMISCFPSPYPLPGGERGRERGEFKKGVSSSMGFFFCRLKIKELKNKKPLDPHTPSAVI